MRNGTYKSNLNKFSKYLEDKGDKKKCKECDEHSCVCSIEKIEDKSDKNKVKK